MAGSNSTSRDGSAHGDSAALAPAALLAGLAFGLAGACVTLIGFFGLAGSLSGAGAMVLAAMLVAPYDRHPTAVITAWWQVLVGGAMLTLVGIAVGLGLTALGGFLVATGSILVLAACILGPIAALPLRIRGV